MTSPSKAQELFAQALSRHQAGDGKAALRLYDQVLAMDPDHARALNFSGVLAFAAGDTEGALARLRRSVDRAPDQPALLSNAGEIMRAAGRLDEAEETLRACLAVAPDNPAALNNMGCVSRDKGDKVAAADWFARAVAAKPDYGDALYNLGVARLDNDDAAGALDALNGVLGAASGHADAWAMRGEALTWAGRNDAALEAFEAAWTRCDALRLVDRRAVVRNLAAAYKRARRYEQVTALLRDAARRFPGDRALREDLVLWLEETRHLADARALVKSILKTDPANVVAHLVRARLAARDGDFAAARDILEAIPADDRTASVLIELGKLHDRLGDAERAYACFQDGHERSALSDKWRRIDARAYPALLARLDDWLTSGAMAALADRVPDDGLDTPCFLVGFSRSGTTLFENVLAASDDFVITDEQPFLASVINAYEAVATKPYPQGVENLADDRVAALRAEYWRAARKGFGPALDGKKRLLDKLPFNICHLGLIRRLFPEAPILVMLRNPLDVVLSNFMQDFAPNRVTRQFLDLGDTARTYAGVMGLWLRYRDALDGAAYHEVRYEDLVADFEAVVRGALAFLGLPWSDDFLRYHEKAAQRVISTASARDVTSPIFTRAAGRWKAYAAHLAPVLPILSDVAEGLGYDVKSDG